MCCRVIRYRCSLWIRNPSMLCLTANQQKQLARKIRVCKDRCFPERGGGKRLAGMLGISPQLLTNWMGGARQPSPLQLAELARIFNISLHELCSFPYTKRKSKVSDQIIALTKYHEEASAKGASTHIERKRLHAITSLIYSELGDYIWQTNNESLWEFTDYSLFLVNLYWIILSFRYSWLHEIIAVITWLTVVLKPAISTTPCLRA